ncbi:MAG TPA: GNAT family N-acetyltransferase, partial [Flavisolibacter sp.]
LTQDEKFWAGCKSCINFDILMSKERKNCLCTAMLYDPKDHYEPEETSQHFTKKSKVYERLLKIKQSKFLKRFKKPDRNANRKLKMSIFNLFHF